MKSRAPAPRRTLGFLLRDTSRLMRRQFIQRAKQTGSPLNQSEASLLRQVAHQEGITQVTLASHLDIEPITVARLIDRLETSGLLERRPHAHDRRVWTVWLTPKARPLLAQIDALIVGIRADALAGLDAAQRQMLIDLLVAVRGNLSRLQDDDTCNAMEASPRRARHA